MAATPWTELVLEQTGWVQGTFPPEGYEQYVVVGGAVQPAVADISASWTEVVLAGSAFTESSVASTIWTERAL